MRRGDPAALEGAVADLEAALRGAEEDAQARNLLAAALREIGRLARAVEEAERAVAAAPGEPLYRVNLGDCELSLGVATTEDPRMLRLAAETYGCAAEGTRDASLKARALRGRV